MGCFPCFQSSKGSKKCWKCWKGKSSIGNETSRKRKRWGICFSSKKSGCTCCFICGKSSKYKEPSRKRGKCGMDCFCCNGSSKEEDSSTKGTTCGMCCFKRTKNSSKEPLTRRAKGCMSCFCCCKPSKEEELRLGEEKGTSCCACSSFSERTKCATCCFKGTKNSSKEPLTRKGKGCMSCFCCCKPSKVCACSNLSERMACFRCFKSSKRKDRAKSTPQCVTESSKQRPPTQEIICIGNENIAARVFTYHKLSESTQNFSPECLLGEGGLGKVYKGQLKDTNETIAVKKLDRNGCQENREFLIEVLMLSLLSHPNLISLLGYCAEGYERFLIYDYMPLGSLQDHLLDLSPNNKPLDWKTRMKIAVGAAKGLEHLHDTANPPVIFRNLKASNILLDEDYNARLADFGLDKFGPVRDTIHIATRVMGTYGYCAPEYALTGKLTVMSDIYSFGVVLLELITGRKAMDSTRPINEQRLVDWAMPRFKNKRNMVHMADPLLERNFPEKALYQALAVAAMCIQEEDTTRPLIKDVVNTLQFLATEMPEKSMNEDQNHNEPQTEKSIDESNTDEESLRSSHSDWQSCSTAREDEEETKQEDVIS